MARRKRMQRPKISGSWGGGSWGKMGSAAHARQLRRRGFKGIEIKKRPKKGYTVYYRVKGSGLPLYIWNPRAKGLAKYG